MATKKPTVKQAKLEKLGLKRPIDFILHLPLRYEDETKIESIWEAQSKEGPVQVEGEVVKSEVMYRPRRQLVVTLRDKTALLVLRFLHFYPSQLKTFSEGMRLRVRGEIRDGFFGPEMVHPNYKAVTENTPLPSALTPVYPTTEGLTQAALRKEIALAFEQVDFEDTLSEDLLKEFQLLSFKDAFSLLHYPPKEVDEASLINRTHPAWIRVKFDELLAQQLSMRRAHLRRQKQSARALKETGPITKSFLSHLPFALTREQQRVLDEIYGSLEKNYPMQRLLQGDVGSGKTIVAALCATKAIDNHMQVALLAPTEILADQHDERIRSWLEPLGVRIVKLVGSMKKKEKDEALMEVLNGQAQLIVGTHALIQEGVSFKALGLVIVDEQHRFGVGQRLSLRNKGKEEAIPHQLMMSATPIPRTLAMTHYADLDVSVIGELPPGRKPVVTRLIDAKRRDEIIQSVRHEAKDGKQIYWVCPLIEESEVLQLQTAIETYEYLQKALPELKVGLIHGRLKAIEKEEVMADFVKGEIHLLVSTTVIEVGVDVPNASLMIIEHAERFGLSQLHQLRGRIGRGQEKGVCVLLYQNPLSENGKARLKTMHETTDGFVIAMRDLEIRGPGEFLGTRQSGNPMLRFANLNEDIDLIEVTRKLTYELEKTPSGQKIAQAHLKRWLGDYEEFLKA